jgi:hypothetical protein
MSNTTRSGTAARHERARSKPWVPALLLTSALVSTSACSMGSKASAAEGSTVQGAPGAPYPGMPVIAPIGVRIGKYRDVPASAQGPAVDPKQGYRLQELFAVAEDVVGYFAQIEAIKKLPWDTFVGGHVARTGTRADVDAQLEFLHDIKQAAADALASTKLGEGLNPADQGNPWAVFDDYIDCVAAQCVNTMTPKWASRLAGFDVYIWDQCYSMEQTLRIE